MVQFQRACSDAEFREEFCSHLQLNATEFQQLCYQVLDKKQGTHYQSIRPYGLPQVQPWNLDPFYNPDAHVLRGKFKREIRALLTNDTRELINEPFAARAYTPGDDIRRIDWNFWARSGKLITRSAPEASRAGNSPLYVMFDEDLFVFDQGSDKGLGTKLQFIELIKALQEERKYSDRKIFICSRYCDKFLELNSTMRPEAIANILDTIRTKNNEEQNSRPKDPDLLIADYDRIHGARLAEPPANLLYLSQSYNRIAAVEALYPNIKQRRVYLADPEFLTYPMIRNSWVQS
jgi:hypothetical protein